MHLSINFLAILLDFGSQVGAKLAIKTDAKSIQNGMGVSCERLGASWGRRGGAFRIGQRKNGHRRSRAQKLPLRARSILPMHWGLD